MAEVAFNGRVHMIPGTLVPDQRLLHPEIRAERAETMRIAHEAGLLGQGPFIGGQVGRQAPELMRRQQLYPPIKGTYPPIVDDPQPGVAQGLCDQWAQAVQQQTHDVAAQIIDKLRREIVALQAQIDWLQTECERLRVFERIVTEPKPEPVREVPPLPARALQGGSGVFFG